MMQFNSWFTKAQRVWLNQFVDSYIACIKANDTIPFVLDITERFLILFPLRRTHGMDIIPIEDRFLTIRIVSCTYPLVLL
jgi:hypothetical protein